MSRVLPAPVFDKLKANVVAYGGVGAGRYFTDLGREPFCIIGHAADIDGSIYCYDQSVRDALLAIGVGPRASDDAVRAINAARGRDADSNARVSWDDWATELEIERDSA